MWLMAFASATHDIAADGFYMLGLRQQQQAAYVGVRSTFYRLATLAGAGRAGDPGRHLTTHAGRRAPGLGHRVLRAGRRCSSRCAAGTSCAAAARRRPQGAGGSDPLRGFFATFASFFGKRDIWLILGFILTFRLGEAQLLKLVAPFLKDPVAKGGLGLYNVQYGTAYGTIGIIALTIGGLCRRLADLAPWA